MVVGLPDVGLFWKWVSAVFGEVLDQAEHKSPTQAPQPRAGARKYIRGELNTRMEFDALREKKCPGKGKGRREVGHGLISRGYLKQRGTRMSNWVLQKQISRTKNRERWGA